MRPPNTHTHTHHAITHMHRITHRQYLYLTLSLALAFRLAFCGVYQTLSVNAAAASKPFKNRRLFVAQPGRPFMHGVSSAFDSINLPNAFARRPDLDDM